MRVLFDTNILISYLLKSDKEKTITSIIEAAVENKYTLLLPFDVIQELNKKLTEKKYLIRHISPSEAKEFIDLLSQFAEIIPAITEEIPAIGRDIKDDYLIAYGTVGEADYLVSGDKDLQILKKIRKLKIVSPVEFNKILKKL